ncbi:AraC family transcriptional regulator ligand-binding domain-containing protein [Streptomyces sp. L2]|uniref:AraC family transcriptional regulator ligand-binding domain-containing protein n=1 Tax=Streptomyces sp. L2 TaxID=2162665 RepID=UPI001F50CAFB|nr:AraC family transcriptional regulator ligand-binding domain-containing protein [Streptomyces sp. L2]
MTTSMIRGASLRGFAGLVESLGGDPGELVRRFGIPVEALTSDEGLVPITGHDLMLDAAARDLRCPGFGLRLARAQDYDSMVKEKTLADRCKADPRWLQILPSTELAPWKRFWPVVPTYAHGGISYGEIKGGRR